MKFVFISSIFNDNESSQIVRFEKKSIFIFKNVMQNENLQTQNIDKIKLIEKLI